MNTDTILTVLLVGLLCLCWFAMAMTIYKYTEKLRFCMGPVVSKTEFLLLRIGWGLTLLSSGLLIFSSSFVESRLLSTALWFAPLALFCWSWLFFCLSRLLRSRKYSSLFPKSTKPIATGLLGYNYFHATRIKAGYLPPAMLFLGVILSVKQWEELFFYLIGALSLLPGLLAFLLNSRIAALDSPDAINLFGTVQLPKADIQQMLIPFEPHENNHTKLLVIENTGGEIYRLPIAKDEQDQITKRLLENGFPLRVAGEVGH